MGGEKPTLSQAEKKRLHDEKLSLKEVARKAEAAEKAASLRPQASVTKEELTEPILSKKEQKVAKKAQKEERERARKEAVTEPASVAYNPPASFCAGTTHPLPQPPLWTLPPPPPPEVAVAVAAEEEGTMTVTKLLTALGLPHLATIFLDEEMDIEAMRLVKSDQDLVDLGVGEASERAKILDWVRAPPSASAATAATNRNPISDAADAAECAAVLTANHSTNVKGLKPVLERLRKGLAGLRRITPGRLHEGGNPSETFELRIQRQLHDGSFKLVARNGHTAQDVWIVADTKLVTEEALRDAIECAVAGGGGGGGGGGGDVIDLGTEEGPLNISGAEARRAVSGQVKAKQKVTHEHAKGQAEARRKAGAVKVQLRHLKAAVRCSGSDGAVDYDAHAERNAGLISGKAAKGRGAMGGHVASLKGGDS
eukprot:CAMPEP_0171711290 /NCGR_PEP_ID=MMETSP0991-20121206/16479_1 /TAXON_ID=483369 /ORGANISM="non described non described, Strain CCMP2098" /LENGTH=425 /DNA_ID=CAMNT_0012301547 /DNA_START=74 /DNA_END=1348 /DNA_ORIENTATION=+